MSGVIPSLRDTIFDPCCEIVPDFAEIGMDYILESEVAKDIPIVRSILALCKIGYNLKERNLLKQTFAFINGFNKGSISEEKLISYKRELIANPDKQEKELGRVLIVLDRYVDDIKSAVLGYFYNVYINGDITWEEFCDLEEANSRMFVSDYIILEKAYNENGLKMIDQDYYKVQRLIAIGLLQNKNPLGGMSWMENVDLFDEKDIVITSFGTTFSECIGLI